MGQNDYRNFVISSRNSRGGERALGSGWRGWLPARKAVSIDPPRTRLRVQRGRPRLLGLMYGNRLIIANIRNRRPGTSIAAWFNVHNWDLVPSATKKRRLEKRMNKLANRMSQTPPQPCANHVACSALGRVAGKRPAMLGAPAALPDLHEIDDTQGAARSTRNRRRPAAVGDTACQSPENTGPGLFQRGPEYG